MQANSISLHEGVNKKYFCAQNAEESKSNTIFHIRPIFAIFSSAPLPFFIHASSLLQKMRFFVMQAFRLMNARFFGDAPERKLVFRTFVNFL